MMDQVLIYANGLNTLSLGRQERYSFRNQSESNDNAGTIQVCVRLSKSSDNTVPPSFRGTKVYEKNLIVIVMDDPAQCFPAADQIRRRELALEHRELKMISKSAHQFENLP